MSKNRNEIQHRINEDLLDQKQIRLVGEEDEADNGLVDTDKALAKAVERGKDLVEITVSNDISICRIVEYSKFKYELKKKEKEKKAKQHVVEMKEIRFGPNTDEHDFNFKVKHAEEFLKDGDKVKATIVFRGRAIVYKERGEKLLKEFAIALENMAKVEYEPKMEGKRMFMILMPKK